MTVTMTDADAAPDSDESIPFVHHVVGGVRHLPAVERWGEVCNPSTGAQVAAVPYATAADVDAAVRDALAAFAEWGSWSALKRSRVMFRFKELLEQHTDELARIIASEHGKVFLDAKGEVQRGIEVVEFCCGIPHLMKGEYSDGVSAGIDSYSLRQPLGVAVGITPFNFPAMVPLWMLAPAIASGNCFVLKPSEKDPSAPVRLAELLAEAGAPPGVLNVVHGDKVAVDALITHPDVSAVSFVGSTPIAQY
ncbi:MAG TPA: aldehyde dehydrogenase family protein, partial [Gemmatimonadaceae bacterium]|nr:aldehyde dehydrogenase family protein [Gemmatimonadaceae bacterium]